MSGYADEIADEWRNGRFSEGVRRIRRAWVRLGWKDQMRAGGWGEVGGEAGR